MKMKSNVILNDDKVIKERLKYCVHITLGRFLNIQRTVSPLSHEKVAGQTTINSSTTWNNSILSYAQVIYTHFIALKCKFYVLHLSKTMIKAIQNGQCIIIKTVDPDKLDDYLPGEILLEQHPDAEELERRKKAREALLSKSMHLRISKSQEQENEKKKKENEKKKKRKEQEKKRKEKEKGDKGKKKSEKRVKLS